MGINIQNVNFRYSNYDKLAIKDLNLEINRHDEFIFLIGKTGSGKSTLLQLMNTLLLPQTGNIYIKDRNIIEKYKKKKVFNTKRNQSLYCIDDQKGLFVTANVPIYNQHLKDLRSHVGLVFQFPEYQLFESTIIKDVMFGPKNFGASDKEALSLARRSLKDVGLDESLWEESPFNLSGGQMRKVALAGILAMNPDILMLDEPTVGLDPVSKDELMKILTTLNREYHKSIIIVSHDMDLVSEYAKRVIVMRKGELVFDNTPRELFKNADLLESFHLDYSYAARLGLALKAKGLIDFNEVPLTFKELESIIRGNKNE